MGSDDICNTGLVLGLGFTSTIETSLNTDNQRPKKLCPNFEPSLTLGLLAGEADLLYLQDSVGASSFSNASVKRERAEEIEAERVSSRMSTDEDDDCINGRTKKLRLSKDQSALLEQSFNHHSTLNPVRHSVSPALDKQKQDLARELKLRPRQVEVWFQNRRARTKLKQTEVDCDFLKKFCETLKDENRRLQKELHELKQLRVAQPLYMQLPGTTLTMCPSCERISSVGADKTSKNHPFKMAPKPHFYNPFTNPSAAC